METLQKNIALLLNCKTAACRYRMRLTYICDARTYILFLKKREFKKNRWENARRINSIKKLKETLNTNDLNCNSVS